ncbi:MAG: ABC transporter ATP-binding protein [Chloroflexota bacterium]
MSGLVHAYGETRVLHGIDLTVPAGSLTAILGPSGCGKTTLLRLIGGFEQPAAGSIRLGERVLCGSGRPVPPEQRRIGYVAQEGALFPHLRVAENVAFGLRLDRASRRRRVDELLAMVGLDASYGDRYPDQLSGGQQQRVALARALAPEPSVILLDEPFASLDASLRESTRRAVAESLAAAGATAILVTHDQAEALSLADQVAVMRQGRLVQVAAPRELYLHPADVETAHSIGEAVILAAEIADGRASSALGSLTVQAGATAGPAQILVRPEQIAILAPDTNGTPVARVQAVSYFGHDALVRLELPDGTLVTARPSGLDAPRTGQSVAVSVRGPVHAFRRQ